MLLASAALAIFLFVIAVYVSFFILLYRFSKAKSTYVSKVAEVEKSLIDLPAVSIIVNAFNESRIIGRKIADISKLDYPPEKVEVIVIDDNSIDNTGVLAEKALAESNLKGEVLRNSERLGLNKSLNIAFAKARNSLICVTDSDVLLEPSALRKSVSVLKNFENAGGVTGRAVPIASTSNAAISTENSYRSYYDRSMLSESSFHSAFPGNGPLIVFDKTTMNPSIPEDYGSTDANIAMNVIKSGKRFLYVPDAFIYEPVAESFRDQKLQKVRRAQRLIQVMLHNSNVFGNKKYGKFGTRLFPLKFLLFVICPTLTLLGAILFSLFLAFNPVPFPLQIGLLLSFSVSLAVLAFSHSVRDFFFSYVSHQLYLIIGLFSALRKSSFWKTIDRKQNLPNSDSQEENVYVNHTQ